MINPKTLAKNSEVYKKSKERYPYEVITPHYAHSRLSPLKFQVVHPEILFSEIPLTDGMHWMFETKEDRHKFVLWRNGL
jgi:hypothetical protein